MERKIPKSEFQLKHQRVTSVNFELNKYFNSEDLENKDPNYSTRVKINKHHEDNMACVELTLELNKDEESLKSEEYNMSAVIKGYFEWTSSISDKIDNYLGMNAPVILLSYIRSTVASTTSVAGMPPVVIPVLNFSK